MPAHKKIKGRYETLDMIGKGGMGLVYKAYDTVVQREVALKTLRDAPSKMALDLFRKECGVLASMSHPNIVEIFDIGEFTEEGVSKPYFVMPLLPGVTLDHLIRTASQRLTVERTIEIILQTCKGLHAAHERGLVHRDLKPSNIFVMPDDSVKIIDFGVAHMADRTATMTVAGGTLPYMAPEQLEMKPATPLSDIFSLGVVFYETLTRRRPFDFPTDQETANAILHQVPPPVSEINPAVGAVINRVIHKAMAKQPWNRFSSAKEFAETLQKAQRNEAIEFFDTSRIQPRIVKATKAFEQGNYQFAAEILTELESEGHVETNMTMLRRQLDQAVRQKTIGNLLESARTCMDEDEYLLALQKIQEILQLEPNNTAALTMRSTIDSRRNEQKVGEWIKLARQHLENNAFTHAREALQNLLQLNPKDTNALQMLSEVDRREEQYTKARQEKEQLYNAALEAWQSGEMSSALTKLERLVELDRRIPDTSAPDRGISYQNFYNQVRSEDDLIKSSYQEARKHLVDGNFAPALAICQQYLGKYPGHALFQALKFDVEERQRQDVSSRVAEIDRRVEAEPDLEMRANILKEALENYPGEPHFERALRVTRDKRDLVNSIVAKARAYEERSQFNEAQGQWEILQTIHKQYPGLEFEIQRVMKRREQQARNEAKARWVEQIDRQLEAGDYEKAIELVRKAVEEFPGDSEMAALDTLAKQSQIRAAEAQQLFAQGQQLCTEHRYQEAIELLQKAYSADQHNTVIRTFLVESLLEQARAVLDSDWRASEALTQQALDLDPNHSLAKGVRGLALDRKQEAEVNDLVAEARQLQAFGNVQGALTRVEEGLSTYPEEPRLAQLWATLAKSSPESQARMEPTGKTSAPKSGPPPGSRMPSQPPAPQQEPVQSISQQRPGTSPPAASAALAGAGTGGGAARNTPWPRPSSLDLGRGSEDEPTRLTSSASTGGTGSRRVAEDAEVSPGGDDPLGATVLLPTAVAAAPSAAAVKQPKTAKKGPLISRKLVLFGMGGGLVLGLLIAALVALKPVTVTVRTNPAGATVRINNEIRGTSNLVLKLPAGVYRLDAIKEGYFPGATSVVVKRWTEPTVNLNLKPVPPPPPIVPLPQTIRLASDLASGNVKLDDRPAVDLQEGQFTSDAAGWGKHTLEITSGRAKATISFEATASKQPVVTEAPSAKEMKAVVVTSYGSDAHILTTYGPVKVSVNGQPEQDLGPNGLDVTGLAPGNVELALNDGKQRQTVNFTTSAAPALSIFLNSDREVGTMLVLTGGEDGVQVLINGKPKGKPSKGGQVVLSNLPVKDYAVKVQKDGFQDEPEQLAHVKKGEEAKLEFHLRPSLTVAALTIKGAAPGTQVSLDQKAIGTVGADGGFSHSNIGPGNHQVELSDGKGHHKRLPRAFKAGEAVLLTGNDVLVQSTVGTIHLVLSPASAVVTYTGADNKTQKPAGPSLELEEGSYTFTAKAPNYTDAVQSVKVVSGSAITVNLSLSAKVVVPQKVKPPSMEEWAKSAGWELDNGWYSHRSGGMVLYPATPVAGTIVFTSMRGARLLGAGHIQWVVNAGDARNNVFFEIGKKDFHRVRFVDGKKDKDSEKKASVKLTSGKEGLQYSIKIDISPESIVTSVQQGSDWVTVDTFSDPGHNLADGKFGFYLPGNDEIMISNLSFTPK